MCRETTAADLPRFRDIVLDDFKRQCIWTRPTNGFLRCGNPVNKADRDLAARLRQLILSSGDSEERSALLREYAVLCCCKSRHRVKVQQPDLIQELCQRWAGECERPETEKEELERRQRRREKNHEECHYKTPVNKTRHDPIQKEISIPGPGTGTPNGRRPLTRSFTNSSRNAEPDLQPTPTSYFTPYKKNPLPHELRNKLKSPLTQREKKSGTDYLFTRAADPKYGKIGYTEKSEPDARLKSWRTKCKYVPQLRHHVNVPNAERVEKLIHLELVKYRRREHNCGGCGGNHEEWFEIDVDTASRVMDRWAKWMREGKPYDERGHLTREWSDKIEKLSRESRPINSTTLLEVMGHVEEDEDEGEDEEEEVEVTVYSPTDMRQSNDHVPSIKDILGELERLVATHLESSARESQRRRDLVQEFSGVFATLRREVRSHERSGRVSSLGTRHPVQVSA